MNDLDHQTHPRHYTRRMIADEIAQAYISRLHLQETFGRLKARYQSVLIQRFGLDGNDPKTLVEVGDELGITKERVRQLQDAGLAKLRGMMG